MVAPVSAATWSVRPRAAPEILDGLSVESPLLAQLLINRGVTHPADAARFLDREGDDPADSSPMAGMSDALQRIERALDTGERIVVYGDYDVDGLSGATLLALALRAAGGRVEVFIPHRERDGYGLNAAVLDRLAAETGLVVSVDCGVTASAEVESAAAAGLDVIVTDHHHVPVVLPRAVAVLNPHRPDCPYPFKQLAGAGVALRLAQAVLERFVGPADAGDLADRLYELAALGTVADVVPLVGENRAIVRRGLRRINDAASLGLRALCRRAKLTAGWIDAEAVAFKLSPRLNAAGRMADALVAHRLLAAANDVEAESLADRLEVLNAERRSLTDQALAHARAEVAMLGPFAPPAIVIAGPYPSGLLGLVAARLAEETRRPVAVIQAGDEICRGSIRSVPGCSAVAALEECRELLLAFGGHDGAAGLSVRTADLEQFRARFVSVAEPMVAALPPPEPVVAECRLRPSSINWSLCEMLARLEPFGNGNPVPLFETRGLRVRDARVVGGQHLRLMLTDGAVRLPAILFDAAEAGPQPGQSIDLLHRVRRNFWRGEVAVELEVAAWRPAAV